MINPYEKIIKVIRDQGRTDPFLFTGVLRPDGKLVMNDLILSAGDFSKLEGVAPGQQNSKVLVLLLNERFIILGKVVE